MSSENNIFISWSGDHSRRVAEALHSWLPLVIDGLSLWISSHDLPEGRRWVSELSERLEASNLGILVVTPHNRNAPWLVFEAGALSKDLQKGRVVPYLVGLDKKSLQGPLGQFQAVECGKAGTRRLVEAINDSATNSLTKQVLTKRFDSFWPELDKSLQDVLLEIGEMGDDADLANVSQISNGNDIQPLREELAAATDMIRQLVQNWGGSVGVLEQKDKASTDDSLSLLEGAWVDLEDRSHLYMRIVNGNLIAPYCYLGNDVLTAEYFDWKKAGDYWFARFRWFGEPISGFSLYRLTSANTLEGKWWVNEEVPDSVPDMEHIESGAIEGGTPVKFVFQKSMNTPKWAEQYFNKVLQRSQGK